MCSGCLLLPTVGMTGKGYMGGAGNVSVAEEPVVTDTSESDGGIPDTVEGPINDKKSDSGKLFGDLYKLLRQQGVVGDKKLVPQVNADGPVIIDGFQRFDVLTNPTNDSNIAIGGEPVLTVIDPSDLPVDATSTVGFPDYSDYGWYAAETVDGDSYNLRAGAGTHSRPMCAASSELRTLGGYQAGRPASPKTACQW